MSGYFCDNEKCNLHLLSDLRSMDVIDDDGQLKNVRKHKYALSGRGFFTFCDACKNVIDMINK